VDPDPAGSGTFLSLAGSGYGKIIRTQACIPPFNIVSKNSTAITVYLKVGSLQTVHTSLGNHARVKMHNFYAGGFFLYLLYIACCLLSQPENSFSQCRLRGISIRVQSFLLEQVLTSGRTFTFTLFYQSDQPGSSLLLGLSRGIE